MNFQDRKLIPSKYIYLLMAFICLILLVFSVIFGERFSALRTVTSAVVTPMQTGINELGTKLYNNVIDKKEKARLIEENETLRKQLEEAQATIKSYEQDSYELKRVQNLLELKDAYSDYEMVGARVIATDSTNWFYTFIINKGTKDGIEVGCNVLAGNGLAGIVTEVGANYAKVRAIIDENSHISACVSGTDILCTVSGDLSLIDDGYIKVGYINKQDKIEEGAQLVTSHVSDKFLPGILIGYISDVKVDANNLTQSAKCIPVVNFRNLQEVMVILTRKDSYKISSSKKTIYDNISNTEDMEDSSATTEALSSEESGTSETSEDTSENNTSEESSTTESEDEQDHPVEEDN